MSLTIQLKQKLMTLPQPDRAALATFLLDSLDEGVEQRESELEQAWYDEAERRVKAYQTGQIRSMSLDEAIEEISRAYH